MYTRMCTYMYVPCVHRGYTLQNLTLLPVVHTHLCYLYRLVSLIGVHTQSARISHQHFTSIADRWTAILRPKKTWEKLSLVHVREIHHVRIRRVPPERPNTKISLNPAFRFQKILDTTSNARLRFVHFQGDAEREACVQDETLTDDSFVMGLVELSPLIGPSCSQCTFSNRRRHLWISSLTQ